MELWRGDSKLNPLTTPDTATELTFEWLAQIAPHDTDPCRLTSIRVDQDLGAPSANGEIVRVLLDHSSGTCGPASLVLKFPNLHGPSGTLTGFSPMSSKESRVYRLLSNHPQFAVPKLYGSFEGHSPHHMVLVLEDMSPAEVGSQVTGVSTANAHRILGQLAEIHAEFWGADYLPENPTAEQVAKTYGDSLVRGIEILNKRWSDDLHTSRSTWEWLVSNLVSVIEHRRGPRSTLIHGDVHAENILFTSEPERPTVLIDWQLSGRGLAAHDVSHFLVGNLSVDDRRSHEPELLRHYHDRLTGSGAVRYTFDDFFLDYRASICRSLVRPVFGLARAERSPNPDDIYPVSDANFKRMNAAIVDLDPVGAIRELGY